MIQQFSLNLLVSANSKVFAHKGSWNCKLSHSSLLRRENHIRNQENKVALKDYLSDWTSFIVQKLSTGRARNTRQLHIIFYNILRTFINFISGRQSCFSFHFWEFIYQDCLQLILLYSAALQYVKNITIRSKPFEPKLTAVKTDNYTSLFQSWPNNCDTWQPLVMIP